MQFLIAWDLKWHHNLQQLTRINRIRQAAEKFEAIFLHQFLKEARKTKLADDLFGSNAKSTYEDMLDQEHADMMSTKMDLGIAEALVRQFDKSAM